jgi:nucleoside-diphosphate-sugar epimerase
MIDGIVRLTESDVVGPVNLGNPHEFTVSDLAREVLAVTHSRSSIRFEPLPQDDPRLRRPDIERARRLLGFEPRVSLREGLARTVEAFRAAIEAGSPSARTNGVAPRESLNGGAGAG